MIAYRILITPSALEDIEEAVEYYNTKAEDLGFKMAEVLDAALQKIADLPTAYSYRYRDVRGKFLKRFPYLILFQIDETQHIVKVLRVFNTYEKPYWMK